MPMWTFCGFKVPCSTLRARFCPFCSPGAMPSPPRGPAKAKVKATGEKIPVTCRASVQLSNSTPHPDPVKPEMLIPQRPYFTWHLPVLTFWCLPFAAQPKCPVLTMRAGGHCLPQLVGTKSPLLTLKHKEKEKNPTAFTQPRGALACLKVLCPAASSSQPRHADLEYRQTDRRTDRQTLKHKKLPGSLG